VESQFIAYLFGHGGLYIGVHDQHYGIKNIDFKPEGNGIKLQFRLYSGLDYGQDYHPDFDLVCRFFDGDWHDAAQIYRNWFEANQPDGLQKIENNLQLPGWYNDSPVVVTYPVRGLHDMDDMVPNKLFPYLQAIPIINELAARLDCQIMVLLMHWEGTAPWAPPFVWPPYGGEILFAEFAEQLHRSGNLLGVYCSGLGWTQQSNLIPDYNQETFFQEQQLADAMCLSPTGDLPFSKICTGQRSGYDLCPSSSQTIDILNTEITKMLTAPIDYIQILDQNHGGNSYFCYSRQHGHPPVPGSWQTDAMRGLLRQIRSRAGRTMLGCESAAAEPYISELLFSDNRYNLNFIFGRPVPLYAFIYHQYVNNFMGNQVCLNFKPTEDNLLYRLAYSCTAGDMMTLVLTDDGGLMQNWGSRNFVVRPNQAHVLSLVKNLNQWRRTAAKKYLHSGRMIKPWLIDWGGGQNSYQLQDRSDVLSVDKLLTSRWLASDGSEGQFIVNYNPEPITWKITRPADGLHTLFLTPHEATAIQVGTKYTLAPLSAVLIITCRTTE